MNVLCVGDVVGTVGCDFLRRHLPSLKKLKNIDAVIVNGENSADSNGITRQCADHILTSGADCITTGNHSFQRQDSFDMYDDETLPIVRPANYPEGVPGRGMEILDFGRRQLAVINLMGIVTMREPLCCPFKTADALIAQCRTPFIIVDFHAEATSEKRALAEYLDGRVSAVFGTHTHVQTADEQILAGGTGFITDVGMTGPVNSVIGMKPEVAIHRFTTHLPFRNVYADGPCMINAVLFELDDTTGKTLSVERIIIK
ncbi:MAG: TIGR00282 family metallophosphoesterase [Ruminococcaceae bacterium]|nr:TIGR00282 family metallophosphoesterase [Oscillospiraceae bacterium]